MPQRTTTLGSPAAPSWSADWLARVESEEKSLRRRICGAMTQAATPCTLGSNHPSGRCRYHGGVLTVGPPYDNQNARIHGLYARRLQRCGPHCPLWKSCAYAGDDVFHLPEKQRPVCAYERDEYAALVKHYFNEEVEPPVDQFDEEEDRNVETSEAVTSRRTAWDSPAQSESPEPFLLHQLVLLTIMQTRAAAALSEVALTTTVEVDSPNYKMKTAKPAAALEAFIRIAREYRALRVAIDTKKLMPKPASQGLGSRLRSLMLRGRKALEESIVDLDAVEKPSSQPNQTTDNAECTEVEVANKRDCAGASSQQSGNMQELEDQRGDCLGDPTGVPPHLSILNTQSDPATSRSP